MEKSKIQTSGNRKKKFSAISFQKDLIFHICGFCSQGFVGAFLSQLEQLFIINMGAIYLTSSATVCFFSMSLHICCNTTLSNTLDIIVSIYYIDLKPPAVRILTFEIGEPLITFH